MTKTQRQFLSTLILWDNNLSIGFKLSDDEKTLLLTALLRDYPMSEDTRKQLNVVRDSYLREYGKWETDYVGEFGEQFNYNELAHVAGNYAITCMKGYAGNFEDWYNGISPNWKRIANRKK